MTEGQKLKYEQLKAQSAKHLDKVFEALGWMHAECITSQKAGYDLATLDVAEIVGRARRDLCLDTLPASVPMPPDVGYARQMLMMAQAYLKHNDPEFVDSVPESLKEVINIQCSDGNWNFDPYMHGMANGMILAQSCITDEAPEFLEAPETWLIDKEKSE